MLEVRHHLAQLLPSLGDRLGAVAGGDRVGDLERGLWSARAIAVVIGSEVVGDADQPGPQWPAVGLATRPVDVTVGLQEGLLGEVLGVVLVADPVVGVGIDVAQVGSVEILEGAIELGLGGRIETGRLDVLAQRTTSRFARSRSSSPAISLTRAALIVQAYCHQAAFLDRSTRRSPATQVSASISPRISAANPESAAALPPLAEVACASRGTASSPSEAWPI